MLLSQVLTSADYNPARIRKIDKLCGDELDLKDKKFPVNKIRDVHKIKKKKILLALVFLVLKTRKNNIQSISKEMLSKDMLIY